MSVLLPQKMVQKQFFRFNLILAVTGLSLSLSATQPLDDRPIQDYRYTVQKGDTLWGISQKLLSDPWMWTQIWKQNETISNPNLIYPRQILLISVNLKNKTITITDQPSKEQLSKALEPAEIPRLAIPALDRKGVGSVAKVKKRKPAGDVEMQKYDAIIDSKLAESGTLEADKTAWSKKLLSEYSILSLGFVANSKYIATGKIEYLEKPSIMISEGDILFVSFQNPAGVVIGDKLYLIRKSSELIHPVSHVKMGLLIQKTGEIQILEKLKDVFRAKVTQAFEEIVIQDRIYPFASLKATVQPKIAGTQVNGVIIGAYNDKFISGTNDVVFLDKGSKSGVEVGNLLSVLKFYKDKVSGIELYRESGQLIVIDTTEEVSTALVINSNDTILSGDSFRTAK